MLLNRGTPRSDAEQASQGLEAKPGAAASQGQQGQDSQPSPRVISRCQPQRPPPSSLADKHKASPAETVLPEQG